MIALNWSKLRNCAERIKWSRTKQDDIDAYTAAVLVASYCHDDALTEFGGFDFDDRSEANGIRLLMRLEACIVAGRHKDKRGDFPNSLVSMIGARGIRTSELRCKADYVLAAQAMFAPAIGEDVRFDGLEAAIKAMPKRQRKDLADRNVAHLPADWVSTRKAERVAA